MSSYPVVQVKLAVSPKEEPERVTFPLEGAVRGVQVTTAGREGPFTTTQHRQKTAHTLTKLTHFCRRTAQCSSMLILKRLMAML